MTQLRYDEPEDFPPDSWDGSESVTPDQLKVVVVDDDQLMRRLLQRALTGLGFTQITYAENGAEGLVAAERVSPAIIISDYHMPQMHGLEFVEAVRAIEALDQAVIIMLSAADDPVVIEGARDRGADTFMVKPFDRADLKQLIDTLYHRFNAARIQWPE